MDLQMKLFRRYFTESFKIFIAYATITKNTDEINLSVFYREL